MLKKMWFLIFLLACGEEKSNTAFSQKQSPPASHAHFSDTLHSPTPTCDSLQNFQTLKIAGGLVDIALPDKKIPIKGNLLILQGFAFHRDDWCKKSSLCRKALAEGYVLIMPEMGKSNYMSQLYPETRPDWRKEPQKHWLIDSVFSFLQKKYCLLLPSQKNFAVGLSTGGRGVAVVALEKPELFTAVAALSGDYEQSKIPQDKVHIGYLGDYQKFPKRWQEEENIVFQIKKWKTPIYLGHGKQDKVCPYTQTQIFYEALRKNHPKLKVKVNLPEQYAHDYKYWDYEVDNILAFFREFL
ncbi:MAG: prolyl oligopeptidase family serine peptidase [Raineya sp.]|nr:prolyl oligopeptidase family serine peptidase [Raineya sp.]MDW8297002.1 prolyl oligopeptidase family serine peptidase [Raineya sp.]